jgi:hypothetical protein
MSSPNAKALAVAAAVLAGAYLRRAVVPVAAAYRIGRAAGRVRRGH